MQCTLAFLFSMDVTTATNLITYDYHLIRGSVVITSDKLTSTEIYSILI